MTSRLNIRPFCSPTHLSRHSAVLKSLPVSFEMDGAGEVDIALAQSDDGSLALAQDSLPGALVVADAANLSAVAAARLTNADLPVHPLMILSSLSAYPALLDASNHPSLIRSHFSADQGLRFTLVEHLSFLELACGPLTNLRVLHKDKHGYAGQANYSNGAPILWTGRSDTSNARFDLDWIAVGARLEIVAELSEFGRPPLVRIASKDGLREPTPTYENPLRGFWRRIANDPSTAPRAAMEKLGETIRIVERFGVDG